MAQAALEGMKRVSGVSPSMYRMKETLPVEVLQLMGADKVSKNWEQVPVITPAALAELEGVIFSMPTRFGTMPAQAKTFFDSLGQLWVKNALVGKVAGIMTSSGAQHGGQEATILSSVPLLMHLGYICVGLPYTCKQQRMMDEISGASPYGPSTIVGPEGKRQPSENEKEACAFFGNHIAEIAQALTIGRQQSGFDHTQGQ